MSGPRHKATVAKYMAISLVRPRLYFVLRKLLQSIQKLVNKFKNTIPNYFPQSLFIHVCIYICIYVPALKERKKGSLYAFQKFKLNEFF